MSGYFLIALAFVGLPLLVIWLAKRDRARERHWGDQSSQSSILTGAELDMPRILPVEPAHGVMVSGAPVDDLSHHASFDAEDSRD